MISCTEFIPGYSELFTYLDRHYGREEVSRLWDFLFKPDGKGIPLINYARKDGMKGCVDYWTGTLSEEAADATFMYNLEAGWFVSQMHYCPSKGRLLQLKETLGLEPYYDYCAHCDYYRAALEEVGLTWIRNHTAVDKASCSRILWDPKVFDGVMKLDENTKYQEFHSSDKEYFHPDFHSSMNMGIEYLGTRHGEDDVRAYLTMFANDVYKPVFEAAKQDPLQAVEDRIRETYKLEKAEDALSIENDGNELRVKIAYCPAVRHLQKTGREVSRWFKETTAVVMAVIAENCGLAFQLLQYDDQTGAAEYCFTKK